MSLEGPSRGGLSFAGNRQSRVRPNLNREGPLLRIDRAEDGHDSRREQDAMSVDEPDKEGGGVLRGRRGDAPVSQRFDDEDDQHENKPEQNHRVQPERRIAERRPKTEPPDHPQPGCAGERRSFSTRAGIRLRLSLSLRLRQSARRRTPPTPWRPRRCSTSTPACSRGRRRLRLRLACAESGSNWARVCHRK
jgi:hypothetical protein